MLIVIMQKVLITKTFLYHMIQDHIVNNANVSHLYCFQLAKSKLPKDGQILWYK